MSLARLLHRVRGGWRCKVGIHRLRGHRDCGDGVNVAPYNAHAVSPGPNAWRVCTWCGALWESAYDPLYGRGWWRRVR